MRFIPIILTALLLTAIPAPATAAPAASGPDELRLVQTPDGLLLSWQAPMDWNPDEYRVWVNGKVFALVEETSLLVGQARSYAVQAIDDERESVPSLLVGTQTVLPLECDYTSTNTNMSKFPFVFVRFHEDCLYWIYELLGRDPPAKLPILINVHTAKEEEA